jgi:hypothetical protein
LGQNPCTHYSKALIKRRTNRRGTVFRKIEDANAVSLLHSRALQYSYANLSLLFARYHAKIIPWGHKTADFVALGFQDSDEDDDEEDHEE